jgi:hypothetical protein
MCAVSGGNHLKNNHNYLLISFLKGILIIYVTQLFVVNYPYHQWEIWVANLQTRVEPFHFWNVAISRNNCWKRLKLLKRLFMVLCLRCPNVMVYLDFFRCSLIYNNANVQLDEAILMSGLCPFCTFPSPSSSDGFSPYA